MNPIIIDATGLSCPEPLLRVHSYLLEPHNSLTVYVDNVASNENIARAARKHGWSVKVTEIDPSNPSNEYKNAMFKLELTK